MSDIPPIQNPYAAAPVSSSLENAPEGAEAIRNQYLSHEASVKSIGLLYILGGLLGILVGLAYVGGGIAFMTNPALLKGAQNQDTSLVLFIMIIMGAVCLAMSALQLYAAFNIRKLGGPGRVIITVFSCIGLLAIPVGTLISAYFLYLLWSEKGKYIFTPDYKKVVEATPHIKYKTSIVVWILLGLLVLLVLFAIIGGIAAA